MRSAKLAAALTSMMSAVVAHTGGNDSHSAGEGSQGVASLGSGYPDMLPVAVAVATAAVVFLAGVSYLHYRGSVQI